MKTKRNKANRRTMSMYTSVFKFREPYQVVLDADFVITAITQKMDVNSRLENVLGGTIKLMITQCTISHLVKLATEGSQVAQEAVDLTRKLCERRKCNHWKTKASSVECIKGIIGDTDNPLRYMVCTQDFNFRSYLREKVIGVPILYLNRSGTLLLEQEGTASETRRKQLQEDKLHVPTEELDRLNSTLDEPIQLIQNPTETTSTIHHKVLTSAQKLDNKLIKNKKRKKIGAPNPLSVKKKKKKSSSTTNNRQRTLPKSTSKDLSCNT